MPEDNDTQPEAIAGQQEKTPRPDRLPAIISAKAGPAILAETRAALSARLPSKFIGRADLLTEVNGYLAEQKAVLLAGTGGVGKTALAAAIAADWIETRGKAVLWINASADTLGGLCDRVARVYGDPEAPYLLEIAEKQELVRELLSSHEPLVVLDNVRNPKAAREFIRWCTGGLSVLATSRKGLAKFTGVKVGPLKRTDARELFCLYAGIDMPAPGDQLRALDELCETLGDHAYALEIASKLTAVYDFTPSEVLAQCRVAAPDAITAGLPSDAMDDGREHVAAILHTSLKQLENETGVVFAAMGAAFDRGSTAELLAPAAELDEATCADNLRRLEQLSLVYLDRHTEAGRRYAMLPFIHTYARAIQQKKGALTAAAQGMLNSCATYAGRHAQPKPSARAKLDIELGNLLGAVVWSEMHDDHAVAIAFAGHLFNTSDFLNTHHYIGQAFELLQVAISAAKKLGRPADESTLLHDMGRLYNELGYPDDALAFHELALGRAEEAGPNAYAAAHHALGNFHLAEGSLPRALEYYDQALNIARETEDAPMLGLILTNLGAAYALAGDRERAVAFHEQALAISRAADDISTAGTNLANLGSLYNALGRPHKAITYHGEALAIARAADDPLAISSRLLYLGHAQRRLGDLASAAASYEEARGLARQIDAAHAETESLGSLGRVRAQGGDHETALGYYARALEIAQVLDDPGQIGTWRFAMGESFMQLERWEEAVAALEEAHEIRQAHDDPRAAHTADQLKTAKKQQK